MPAGRNENSNRRYMHISYGQFKEKAVENATGAVARETKDGRVIWEYPFDYIEGKITGIYHKEDEKFGNSFEVIVDDGKEKFQISFKEGDNFFNDFFSKLPNTDLKRTVKLVPYAFNDKNTGKLKKGLVIWQGEAKIDNYFTSYNETKKIFEYSNGFPQPEKSMDKEEWKIYFIRVTKFLRKYTQEKIIPNLEYKFTEQVADEIEKQYDADLITDGDLPF
jgi:hypothetical protein